MDSPFEPPAVPKENAFNAIHQFFQLRHKLFAHVGIESDDFCGVRKMIRKRVVERLVNVAEIVRKINGVFFDDNADCL